MRSFPWDSVATSIGEDGYPVYDRVYQASDLREVYETFFSNGVFTDDENALKVSPGSGMTVKVAPGRCCINGTVGYEHEERTLAITSSGNLDRIDTVVLRWDSSLDARSVDLYVLAGAPADMPVRPTLTRSETVWELGLCDVYVTANMAQTKAEKMTDTRLDSNRCGVVAPFVQLNTQNFYDQLQAQTSVAVELAQSALDGTIAGQLQNGIDGKVSKSGDAMDGVLKVDASIDSGDSTDRAGAWIDSVRNAMIRNLSGNKRESVTAFNATATMRTINGYWSMGTIGDDLHFAFVKKSDVDSGNNVPLLQWTFPGNDASAIIKNIRLSGKTLLDLVYPVGCVYISYSSTSPASLFGGSWTQLTGRFLRMDNNVNTGGSDTHSHGAGSLKALANILKTDKYLYEKGVAADGWLPSYWGGAFSYIGNQSISTKHTEAVQVIGDTGSASNVPLYQNLYAWRRTA